MFAMDTVLKVLTTVLVLLTPISVATDNSASEAALVNTLLKQYETEATTLSRPVKNSSNPIIVHFLPSIRKILDIDEQNQVFTIYLWRHHRWTDEYLTWDPSEYDGIRRTRLPADQVWTPDIVLYNRLGSSYLQSDESSCCTPITFQRSLSAGHEIKKGDSNFMVTVKYDGSVEWIPRVIERSSCDLEASDFPFDEQRCLLKYGSWTYTSTEVTLETMEDSASLLDFALNTEWAVIGNSVTKHSKKYDCCDDHYEDLQYELVLRRNPAFLARFMLLPAILLSFMVLIIFWIPPQRPDRTGLAMSVFTSFMLLLLLLVDYIPPTSKSKLGSFYCYDIIGVAMATFLSILVVNISYKKTKMSPCLVGVVRRLQVILCLPGPKMQTHIEPNANKDWLTLSSVMDRIFFVVYIVYFALVFILTFPFNGSSNNVLWF